MKIIEWTLGVLVLLALMYAGLRASKEPTKLLVKYAVTLPFVAGLVWCLIQSYKAGGGMMGIFTIFYGVLFAIAFSIIWAPTLVGFAIKPLTDAFDGGDQEVDAKPSYSIIEARRAQGHFQEALQLIEAEKAKFPNDFALIVLAAQIHAENLNDLATATTLLERIMATEGTERKDILYGLNLLADWHLKIGRDPETARAMWERILAEFPETESAHLATERIAHLATSEYLLEPELREAKKVIHRDRYLGLQASLPEERPPELNPDEESARLAMHLEIHPHDTEAREKLALLYARELNQPDSALLEMQHLLHLSHQPQKRVAHWLHLVADIQIRQLKDVEAAHATLQKIIDQFPNGALAEQAQRRQTLLKVELKEIEETQFVGMQSYEKDLGLKAANLAARKAEEELEQRRKEAERLSSAEGSQTNLSQ